MIVGMLTAMFRRNRAFLLLMGTICLLAWWLGEHRWWLALAAAVLFTTVLIDMLRGLMIRWMSR